MAKVSEARKLTTMAAVLVEAMLRMMLVTSIPAPVSVIDLFVIVTPVVHVAEPAGIMTVSPAAALLIAVWTATGVRSEAVMVAALPASHQPDNRMALKKAL